jgi:hypothetical protein
MPDLPREIGVPVGYCQCGCGAKTTIAAKNDKRAGMVKGIPMRYLTGHANRRTDRVSHINRDGFCECGCGGRVAVYKETNTLRGQVKGQCGRFLRGHSKRIGLGYVVDPSTGCWMWQGHLRPSGYSGSVCLDGKRVSAHVYFFVKHKGPVPAGMHLDHKCRNRACVNPDHLEPVTPAENTRRGDLAKLTHDDVQQIREMLSSGNYFHREIADHFGVCRATVSQIARGARWAT